MQIDNQKILIAIVILTLILFPVVALSTGPLRIVLGFLFAIFFPGYTLLSALFPRRDTLRGLERIALSLGLSIAIVPLIGLVLNYTPWGIRPYPIIISITLFIMAASAIGWYRQHKLAANDRFGISVKSSLPGHAGMSKMYRYLFVFLVVATVTAAGFLAYALLAPGESEGFTEFYILGSEGKASGYPKQVLLGESVDIVIGVVNHEHKPASYRLKIMIDGTENIQVSIGTLAHEAKYEQRISFIPQVAGQKQRVDFYVYKNDEDTPCSGTPLHFYIDVLPSR
jgi:uncharacterized membrane protein